jgi:hypothetical protein
MTATKQTCVECGHIANVQVDCSRWACIECQRIQLTVNPLATASDIVRGDYYCDAQGVARRDVLD